MELLTLFTLEWLVEWKESGFDVVTHAEVEDNNFQFSVIMYSFLYILHKANHITFFVFFLFL